MDAYKEAMTELERLKNENPSSKIFYTKLVDIFRLYIFKRKAIASLQKTTDDLVLQLHSLQLPADDFTSLAAALRMSDFVKFAKYDANEEDKSNSWKAVKKSIDTIEKISLPSRGGN